MRGNLNLYSSNSLGVIVCARMSSTRLPGKFLRKVKDKLIINLQGDEPFLKKRMIKKIQYDGYFV